jgi:hypothetical protein
MRWLTNLRQSTDLLDAPERCVHIADREGDIYELFCEAHEANTHYPALTLMTQSEIDLLDKLVVDKSERRSAIKTISCYLIKIARRGGYLARANDGPPGNKVICRGLSRLISIECAVATG